MPDSDIEVTDLYRRTPRKWNSKTRPFRHMTSMPPKTAPRRTQDKPPINRSWASELSHGRNRTCGCSRLSYGQQHAGLWLRPMWWPSRNGRFWAHEKSPAGAALDLPFRGSNDRGVSGWCGPAVPPDRFASDTAAIVFSYDCGHMFCVLDDVFAKSVTGITGSGWTNSYGGRVT